MKYANSVKAAASGMILAGSLLLAACGSSDSGNSSNGNTSISGVAATGAALTSGTVELSCKDGLKKSGIAISATGTWSTTIPTTNLPCAVKASDGSNTYYSFTAGNGSSIVTNVTPLTTLALAQILGATPDSLFASLSATDLAKLNTSAINAAIAALNAALADYALPAGFNPVTTPLTAATTSQGGNDYDALLDQFKAANPDLATLLADAATGTMPALGTPDYSDGAATIGDFFTKFAGDYTLKVSQAGAEGANNTAVTAMFPTGKAIKIHLKANGDISIDGVGRTLTYLASTYAGNTTSGGVMARTDFIGSSSTQNEVRYRSASGFLDLYLSYNPGTGRMELGPQGFVNNEGYASLSGKIVPAPSALPDTATETCTSGDDKLVFTNGPTDFCGFSKNASANTIENYYQFTSTAGSNGVTYVKFNMNEDGTTIHDIVIENDNYAFGCGIGTQPACLGATFSSGSNYKQFSLDTTPLGVIFGASEGIRATGLLIHSTSSSGTITTPSLGNTEFGVRFNTTGLVGMVGTTTGTQNNNQERFYDGTNELTSQNGLRLGGGQVFAAGGVSAGAVVLKSATGVAFPTTPGTYACGTAPGTLAIQVNYGTSAQYLSNSGTEFPCSITITASTVTGSTSFTGYMEGTFTATLPRFGVTPPSTASGVQVSGSFRIGAAPAP